MIQRHGLLNQSYFICFVSLVGTLYVVGSIPGGQDMKVWYA